MGKFTITFDTETEREAIKRHMMADEMAIVLFEIAHNLKKRCMQEFENNSSHPDSLVVIEYVFEEIYEIINSNNIDITEL